MAIYREVIIAYQSSIKLIISSALYLATSEFALEKPRLCIRQKRSANGLQPGICGCRILDIIFQDSH